MGRYAGKEGELMRVTTGRLKGMLESHLGDREITNGDIARIKEQLAQELGLPLNNIHNAYIKQLIEAEQNPDSAEALYDYLLSEPEPSSTYDGHPGRHPSLEELDGDVTIHGRSLAQE